MSKTETNLLESVSILVGVLVGSILAYFYNTIIGIPMIDASEFEVWNMLIFIAIPVLSGFVSGMIGKSKAMENGLISGLSTGAIGAIISFVLLAMRIAEEPISYDEGSFAFSLIVMLFLWGIVGAMGGRLAKEYSK